MCWAEEEEESVREEPLRVVLLSPESDGFFLRKPFGFGLVLSMDCVDEDDPEAPCWLAADRADAEVDEDPHDCAW